MIGSTIVILAAANCAMVVDPDQRAYCRALEQRQTHACQMIKDYDLRQRCKVELGATAAECATIIDAGHRELCRAMR